MEASDVAELTIEEVAEAEKVQSSADQKPHEEIALVENSVTFVFSFFY